MIYWSIKHTDRFAVLCVPSILAPSRICRSISERGNIGIALCTEARLSEVSHYLLCPASVFSSFVYKVLCSFPYALFFLLLCPSSCPCLVFFSFTLTVPCFFFFPQFRLRCLQHCLRKSACLPRRCAETNT